MSFLNTYTLSTTVINRVDPMARHITLYKNSATTITSIEVGPAENNLHALPSSLVTLADEVIIIPDLATRFIRVTFSGGSVNIAFSE